MIRVSVVSTKDTIKFALKCAVVLAILICIIVVSKYARGYYNSASINNERYISYLSQEISFFGNSQADAGNISLSNPTGILDSELMLSSYLKEQSEVEVDDSVEVGEEQVSEQGTTNTNEEINVQDVQEGQKTEVYSSTYKPTYSFEVEGVKIKNESKYNLQAMNLSSANVHIENKNVLIFHTHTCESYKQTEQNKYEATGNYRTTDLKHSVVRVGDVLQSYLTSYGFKVLHNKTLHDYPAYNGSYGRSLKTVKSILEKNPKTDIVIDLHRDAMADESYAPKVKIGDEYVSQIMFVIGTDGSGLEHPNWRKNLEFAIKVVKKGNEMYPGLFKPIIVRDARYNQNVSSAATIIEFGATGNTLEECEGAAKYLAKVLEKAI